MEEAMKRWFDGARGFARRLLAFAAPANARMWRLPPVLVVGVVGFAASSVAGYTVTHYWDAKNTQAELNVLGDNRRLLLQNALTGVEQKISTVARRMETARKSLRRLEFERAVGQMRATSEGDLEVGWIARVSRSERAQHERAGARDGRPEYRIRALGPDGAPALAGEREEYFPLLYAHGGVKRGRLGLDLQSDPAQWRAMKRARDSDRIAATLPGDEANSGPASEVFLFAPVFSFEPGAGETPDRPKDLDGFIRAAFIPGVLIDQVFRRVTSPRGLDISFFQPGAGPAALPFHTRPSLLRDEPAEGRTRAELQAGFNWTGDVTLGDTSWMMIVSPIRGAPLLTDHAYALTVVTLALLSTAAAMIYVEISRLRALRVQGLLADLRASEEKFRRLSDNAQDGIVMVDAHGNVCSWNPAAERIFGYKQDEIMGRSVHHVLAAERYRSKAIKEYSRFAQTGEGAILGRTVELAGRHKDGSEIPLELSVSAVYCDNSWQSIAIARDITERHAASAALEYRNALLHVVSASAAELLTAETIADAIPNVLKMIGEAAHVDRVLVIEICQSGNEAPAPIIRYSWQTADVAIDLDHGFFAEMTPPDLEMDPWLAPLSEGKPVMGRQDAMNEGAAKTYFERFGIHSALKVPMIIEGQSWGRIGFDDCKTEREWTSIEVDILCTAGDLISGSIIRERYIAQLKDANAIIERSPTILYRLRGEPSQPMIYVSHNISLFGYDPAEMVAEPQLYKTYIHPDDLAKVQDSMAQAAMDGSQSKAFEYRHRMRGGGYRWVENYYTPIRDAAGRLIEIEGILTDVTERKAVEEKIARLARTDGLTGLANRGTFFDRLRHAFAAAKRGARPFAVLSLDVDHFKDINDTLGHSAGDLLLKCVADRLTGSCRESDLAARLGGDEFVVLQSELTDLADATTLASKIHDLLTAPYSVGNSELRVTVSIGISFYSDEMEKSEEMLTQADLALYRAKEEGRDQYCFHSADLDLQVRERVTLTDDLKRAFGGNELELYYQPQVQLTTGRIVGMEALIRWNHPSRGVLRPADFLSAVEKTGVAVALGHWVLNHACAQMNAWREAGIAPLTIAVNVTLGELRMGEEYVDAVMETLSKWGLAPNDLELDVTESMLAYITLSQNKALDRLTQLGVQVAIDDFGSQYSSLDYLKTYQVSRLKIPRSMMDGATHDANNLAMVRAILGVARELNVEVVGQGVDTEMERELLMPAPATTKAQGCYYSGPVQAKQATELLRRGLIEPHSKKVAAGSPNAKG
jgi:diguanylate cyclase (GGDEF)-like protein/PAS domain S-box-containing protein